ncbi:hypothetical protein GGU11DRAFT_751981 [Lentinula aff. detonsa]|nr:hypothetical protein GGU11DRAFT_751981 [Lentinula aff. detonsa]
MLFLFCLFIGGVLIHLNHYINRRYQEIAHTYLDSESRKMLQARHPMPPITLSLLFPFSHLEGIRPNPWPGLGYRVPVSEIAGLSLLTPLPSPPPPNISLTPSLLWLPDLEVPSPYAVSLKLLPFIPEHDPPLHHNPWLELGYWVLLPALDSPSPYAVSPEPLPFITEHNLISG